MKLFGRIGYRLLRWFILVALIPLIFMGYQGYYFARQAVQREVFLHMQAVTESKRLSIEQWFRERQTDLRLLSSDPELTENIEHWMKHRDNTSVERIFRDLESYQKPSLSYAYICLHDREGNPIACTMGTAPFEMTDLVHTALFADVLKSADPVMSPIYLQRGLGPGMHVAAAVRDTSGQPLAILVATLALAHTLNPIILDTTGLGTTGQAYLVDTKHVMLTPSRFMHHPDPLTHTMDSEGIRAALQGTRGTSIYEGFEGQKVMGAWEYMPEQQWALIAEMNADEAFAPLAMLRRNAILVAAITLAAILLVVAWVSRSISLPIQRLADASLAVSRGDLDRKVAVSNLSDEVGELTARFNGMVTSLRESQRQLVQSERLAAIGELVASVVHEIRNPLSAIKMNLRILEHKSDTDDPVLIEHFELAKTQMDKLESMLSELLDYSKPIQIHRQPVPVKKLIDSAIRHLPDGSRSLPIEEHLADPSQKVNVDPEKMEQVLLNLLLNAKEAIANGGKITVISEQTSDGFVLSILDTGHGISAENQRRIFEPFFTTRKHGTGLGLPNARKIVEAHGGAMFLRSEANKGTEVQIVLPEIDAKGEK